MTDEELMQSVRQQLLKANIDPDSPVLPDDLDPRIMESLTATFLPVAYPIPREPDQRRFASPSADRAQLDLAVLASDVIKGEETVEDAARRSGIKQEVLDRICCDYYDYLDQITMLFCEDKFPEAEIERSVLDVCDAIIEGKIAFKIV